jgi:hypothetical protein
MPTKDKLYISVDLYARWRITDPLQYFFAGCGTTRDSGRGPCIEPPTDGVAGADPCALDSISVGPGGQRVVRGAHLTLPARPLALPGLVGTTSALRELRDRLLVCETLPFSVSPASII